MLVKLCVVLDSCVVNIVSLNKSYRMFTIYIYYYVLFMKAISVLPLNFDIMSLKKLPQCMLCGIHIKKTGELIILLLTHYLRLNYYLRLSKF